MTSIAIHPATGLQELMANLKHVELTGIVRCTIFAFENQLSRRPIAEAIAKLPMITEHSSDALQRFVEWCGDKNFSSRKVGSALSPPNELSKELKDLLVEVRQLGAQAADLDAFARSHKYWFFRPAWEVDSPLWSEIFGPNDPGLVIAFYARNFFKGSYVQRTRRTIHLTADDIAVLDWIIQTGASILCKKGTKTENMLGEIRAGLATSCGLENVMSYAINWSSPSFLTCVRASPDWLCVKLIQYWKELDFSSVSLDENLELRNVAIEEAVFIGAILLNHLAPDTDTSDAAVPRFAFLSDDLIIGIPCTIEHLSIEANARELEPLLHAIAVAVYNARDSLFGGAFPFTVCDATNVIGTLAREVGFWIANFASYTGQEYDPWLDSWRLFNEDAANDEDGCIRTDRHAQSRYEAYRDALESMECDGLRELACAWWAFFIASQVLAFPGFGLPGRKMNEIVTKTKPFLRDTGVLKAIRFALAQEEARPTVLRSRMNLALLRDLVAQGTNKEPPSQIIQLVQTETQVETFLSNQINTWLSLDTQSRRDLIEAEQLWCRAASDYGAGRADWGALVTLYSRPIEAEVRRHLVPLLHKLGKLGLCNVEEPTLGGCVAGIREAKKALRTRKESGVQQVSEEDKARVDALHTFFASQNQFIESFRNRAAHGNRDKPITPEEFLRWRIAIFRDRLFDVVQGL